MKSLEENDPKVVYWYLMGWRLAVIIGRSRKHLKVVLLDGKVKIKNVKLDEERNMLPTDIPAKKVLKSFRESYKIFNRVAVKDDTGYVIGSRLPRMSKALTEALRG
jgi:hypothetical protein